MAKFLKLNIQLFGVFAEETSTTTSTVGSNKGTLYASLTENSTNTANNTSSVTAYCKFTQNTGSFAAYYTPKLQLWWYDNKDYVDGIKLGEEEVTQLNYGSTGKTVEIKVTKDFKHLDDGTLKGKVEAKWIWTGGGYACKSVDAITDNTSLTTIPRANTFKSVPDSANVGQGFTVTLNQKSSSFSTTLVCECNGKSQTVETTTDTATFSLPGSTFASAFGSTESKKTATITATTYSGETQIGDAVTDTITLYLLQDVYKPVVSISAVDTNTTTKTLTGDTTGRTCVLNASTITCTVSAEAQNNATLSSVTINGASVATTTKSYTINNPKTNAFTIIANDSRGFVNSTTDTLEVVDYFKPTITGLFKRNTPTDGKVNLTYSGKVFNKSFGAKNNELSFYYEYKLKSASSYTRVALSPTINGDTFSGNLTLSETYDYKQNYSFRLCVVDSLNTTVYAQDVTKGEPVYWWNNDGVYVNGKLLSMEVITNDYIQSVNGFRGKQLANGSGTTGYMYACDITTTSGYQNQYITFDILQRNRTASVKLLFSSSGTSGTMVVSNIVKTGNSKIYYTNTNNVFSLYIQKSEAYDDIEICNIQKGSYMNSTKITWKNQTVTSLPSGYKEVGNYRTDNKGDFISVYRNSDFTITANNTYTTIPFNATFQSRGSSLTLQSDGGIKIGAGVNAVAITGQWYLYTGTTGQKGVQIVKGDIISRKVMQNVPQYSNIDATRQIVNVTEGDVIYLQANGATNDIIKAYQHSTFMVVEVIA